MAEGVFHSDPSDIWVVSQEDPRIPDLLPSESPEPPLIKSVQSKALNVLSRRDECESLAEKLFAKSEVSVHEVEPDGFPIVLLGPLSA